MLRASYPDHDHLVRGLESFVREAPDDETVRINPIAYAASHALDESQVIDLFLHARKAGLFIMEWHYVCRGCGTMIESFQTLNAAGEHSFCNTCLVNREADLSDFVEIGFSVSKAVRASRFHDPQTLTAKELAIDCNLSASAFARDGTRARDFYWRHTVFLEYVEPGETGTFVVNLEPGFFSLRYGPEFLVDPASDNRVERLDIVQCDGRPAEKMQSVAPGPLTYRLTNATAARIVASALSVSAAERQALSTKPPGFRLGGFLSGSRLLATQTFLDLFPSETVMSAGGLAVKRVAILFTDIKGSTALYDRVGDLKAFNLVRQHFSVLREVIAARHGALIKTIGDAIMASFHEPLDAIHAALEMLAQMKRFNDGAGEELITLKIGAHAGPCLAVTLNERLDYFGRTVNVAARVQGLASENEVYLSDELYRLPDAADLLTGVERATRTVRVKGVEREIVVHALHAPR